MSELLNDYPAGIHTPQSERRMAWAFGILLMALVVLLAASSFHTGRKDAVPPRYASNAFDHVSVQAKSAVVIDVKTGEILYEKDSLSPRPLASITKLMTALAARQALGADAKVEITRQDVAVEGDSGLRAGESFALQKLIDFTLVGSSNDGSQALAAAAAAATHTSADFSEHMNTVSKTLGLNGLLFQNPTGLDVSNSSAGAYGTARDVAALLMYIAKNDPALIAATREPAVKVSALSGKRHTAENTDEALPFIPALIGGKTGFTDLAQGNLGVVFDAGLGRPVAVVVLGSGEKERFADVQALTAAVVRYLSDIDSQAAAAATAARNKK